MMMNHLSLLSFPSVMAIRAWVDRLLGKCGDILRLISFCVLFFMNRAINLAKWGSNSFAHPYRNHLVLNVLW